MRRHPRPWRAVAVAGAALACASGAPAPAPDVPAAKPAPAAARVVQERYAEALAYSEARDGRLLLVLERDQVVVEAAAAGNEPHATYPIHAASEAFWGVAAVAAAEDGLLELDEPVSATLPELGASPRAREMRVRQLLHFTSGFESGARVGPPPGLGSLEYELVSAPGERFQYGPSHLRVFDEVLRRKLEAAGADPDPVRYLERRVLAPAGVMMAWARDAEGRADPADGAHITARSWARFGLLLRDGGRVDGRQVVAAEGVEACLTGSRVNPGFGLGVWLNAEPTRKVSARWGWLEPRPAFYEGGLPDLAVAAGAGNQRLYVIPSLGLVVVRFGERDRNFRDEEFLARLVTAAQRAS